PAGREMTLQVNSIASGQSQFIVQLCFYGLDSSEHCTSSNAALALSTWYQVAGSWDGSSLNVYVNGVLAGNNIFATQPQSTTTFNTILGAHYNGASYDEYFNGTLANLQIYNSLLSSQQIFQLYSYQFPP